MCAICSRFDVPLLVNVVEGSRKPLLSASDYAEIGYQLVIFPGTGFMVTSHALNSVYATLKPTGASVEAVAPLEDFMNLFRVLAFEDVWAFEQRHAESDD